MTALGVALLAGGLLSIAGPVAADPWSNPPPTAIALAPTERPRVTLPPPSSPGPVTSPSAPAHRVATRVRIAALRIDLPVVKPAGGPDAAWEMLLFKNEELVNYLNALQVQKSVYEYVVYDSEVEREFARKLDERDDIKLFVKLPGWFAIDTPVGKYNPDWAILKHDGTALYLVRETKGTRDFLKLRTAEADKVRCGQKHFEAIEVPFAVVVDAAEV